MKTHSTELYELIASMSRKEQSDFGKLHADNRTSYFIRIFELVLKNGVENDQQMMVELTKEGFNLKSYPRMKNYLYNVLLDFIQRNYHESSPIEFLRKDIRVINELIDRGLRKQAEKYLRKAKKRAQEGNLIYGLFELSELEFKLLRSLPETKSFDALFDDFKDNLIQLNGYHLDYIKIMFRELESLKSIIKFQTTSPAVATEVVNQEPLGLEDSEGWEKINQINTLYVEALNRFTENDFHGSVHILSHAVRLFEENRKLEETYNWKYLFILNNYADSSLLIGKVENCDTVLQKLAAFPAKNESDRKLIRQMTSNLQIRVLATTKGDINEQKEAIARLNTEIRRYDSWMVQSFEIESVMELAILNFKVSDYRASLFFINLLLVKHSEVLLPETQIILMLLEILSMFERDNLKILRKKIKDFNQKHVAYKQDFTFLLDPFIHYTENPNENKFKGFKEMAAHIASIQNQVPGNAVRKIQLKEWLLSHAKPTR